MENKFHEIIMHAIEQARKIDCQLEEFIECLQGMVEELEAEIEAAEEGLERAAPRE